MSDYIKREDAIRAVTGLTMYKGKIPVDSAIWNIEQIPSADVVEADKLIEFLKHMAYETAINCVGGGAVKAEDVFASIAEYRLDLWYEAYKAERRIDEIV